MIVLAVKDLGEALDGLLHRHKLAGVASEHLGDLGREKDILVNGLLPRKKYI